MDTMTTDPDVARLLAALREEAVPAEVIPDSPEMFAAVDDDPRF